MEGELDVRNSNHNATCRARHNCFAGFAIAHNHTPLFCAGFLRSFCVLVISCPIAAWSSHCRLELAAWNSTQ
jgi:hypothetical protein